MSLAALFDHYAEVWRPVETTGPAREIVVSFDLVEPATRNCAVVPPVGKERGVRTVDIGPGETTRGQTTFLMARDLDVQERDVIRLVSGPEATSTWRVGATARPRGHHVEAMVEPWVGILPEEES